MSDDIPSVDLGLSFGLTALETIVADITQSANEINRIVETADLSAKSTVMAMEQTLGPILSKARPLAEIDVVAAADELAPLLAKAVEIGDNRKRVLDIPGAFPGGGFLPGNPPANPAITWNVWVRQSCVGDGLANVECVPLPFNQTPEGNGWSVCYGGVSQAEAMAACGKICPAGIVPVAGCDDGQPPAQPPQPTPEPEKPVPPGDGNKCGSCCCCPCSCGNGDGSGGTSSRYCLWRGKEPGQCEILSEDQKEPPMPGWVKVTCSSDREYLERLKAMTCRSAQDQTPYQPGDPQAPGANSLCDSTVWASDAAAQAAASLWSVLSGQAISGNALGNKTENVITWFFDSLVSLLTFSPAGTIAKNIIDSFTQLVSGVNVGAVSPIRCNNPELGNLSFVMGMLSIYEKWIGRIPPRWTASMQYSEAYMCPWLLPTAAEAQRLYLSGVVPDDVAIRLGRFNGVCDDTFILNALANQSRLSPVEIVSALRRGLWDQNRASEELRARGYLASDALPLQVALAEWLPGPTDVIRFVVRDAADPVTVARFQLDAEFDQKYLNGSPEIKRWAQAQGVSDDVIRYFWRSHWEIPSPTQLGEFWRRLRVPGTVDSGIAAQIGLTGRVPHWSPRFDRSLQVNRDDIDAALAQQDILPFWRDRFRETQYLPLTRVDVRRAYDLGLVAIDDVYESLVQDGYSDDNAAKLAQFAYVEKRKNLPNSLPVKQYANSELTIIEATSELVRDGYAVDDIAKVLERVRKKRVREAYQLAEFVDYVNGSISREELQDELADRLYDPTDIAAIIERADRKIRDRFRAGCTDAIKTRFTWGDIDKAGAVIVLKSIGWNDESANRMIESWACARAVSDRIPTVRQLLQWLELGLIDIERFNRACDQLLIPRDDRLRILAQAAIRKDAALDKEAQRERAKEQQRLAKAEAEKRRAADKAARAEEKRYKAAQTLRTEAERVAAMVERAAAQWATFANLPLDVASSLTAELLKDGADTYGLTLAVAGRAVVQSVELAISESEQDLTGVFDLVAGDIVSAADSLAPDVD